MRRAIVSQYLTVFLVVSFLLPTPGHAFLLSYGSQGASTGDHPKFIEKLAGAFRRAHPEALLEVKAAMSYIAPLVETFMYDGQKGAPDVAVVSNRTWPVLFEKSLIRPLKSVLSVEDIEEINKALRPELQVQYYGAGVKGEDFALPFNRSHPVLYVNDDLLPGARTTMTWAEVVQRLEARRRDVPGLKSKFKIVIPLDDWVIEQFMLDARGRPTIEGSTIRVADEESVAMVRFLADLRRRGLVEFVLTQGRAYLDFVQGSTALMIASMSCSSSVGVKAGFPFRITMPPLFKHKLAVVGGGDLLLPGNPAKLFDDKVRTDVRKFVRWFYLEGGAVLWAKLVGYHPVTVTALKSRVLAEQFKTRPQDRDLYLNIDKWTLQSFYRLDRACHAVRVRELFENGYKDILSADNPGPGLARLERALRSELGGACEGH